MIFEQHFDGRAGLFQAGQGGGAFQGWNPWAMTNRPENPQPGVGTGSRVAWTATPGACGEGGSGEGEVSLWPLGEDLKGVF